MEPFDEPFSIDTKTILGLQLPTDPRWVNLAERSLQDILTDHALRTKSSYLLHFINTTL